MEITLHGAPRTVSVDTAVAELVYVRYAGAKGLSEASGKTEATIYLWLKLGHIPKRETALEMAELSKQTGPEIPAAELMNLVAWRGHERHPDLLGNGNGKPRRQRTKEKSPFLGTGTSDGEPENEQQHEQPQALAA